MKPKLKINVDISFIKKCYQLADVHSADNDELGQLSKEIRCYCIKNIPLDILYKYKVVDPDYYLPNCKDF